MRNKILIKANRTGSPNIFSMMEAYNYNMEKTFEALTNRWEKKKMKIEVGKTYINQYGAKFVQFQDGDAKFNLLEEEND